MKRLLLTTLLLLLPLRGLGYPVEQKTLSNGIRILLAPDTHSQFVTLVAYIRQAPPKSVQESALSELVARSLFFGSQNRSFDAVAQSVRQVGGSLETYYSPEGVAISCFTIPSQWREAIYLLSEALKNADFAPDALNRARQIVADNQKKNAYFTSSALRSTLIQRLQSPYEYDPARYNRVTSEQAQEYFKRRYVNERIVLAICGKFDSKQALRSLDNNLFERETVPLKASPAPAPIERESSPLSRQGKNSQAHALLAVKPPAVDHADYPAFTVLNALLGIGHSSRLLHHFREQQGIGYEMGTSLQAHLGEPLIAYLQWDTQNSPTTRPPLAQIQAQLKTQVIEATKQPITESELVRAKSVALNHHLMAQESLQDRAFLLAWYEAMGVGYTFAERLPTLLKSVGLAELDRVAKTWLTNPLEAILLPSLSPQNSPKN